MTTNNYLTNWDEFYLGKTNGDLLTIDKTIYPVNSKVRDYINDLSLEDEIDDVAVVLWKMDLSGYCLHDGWKFDMMNKFMEEINVDDVEKYIGEIGIRKCCEITMNCGFNEELPDISTDLGLKQIFFCVLYETISINEDYEDVDRQKIIDSFPPAEDDEEEEEDDEEEEPEPEYGGLVAAAA